MTVVKAPDTVVPAPRVMAPLPVVVSDPTYVTAPALDTLPAVTFALMTAPLATVKVPLTVKVRLAVPAALICALLVLSDVKVMVVDALVTATVSPEASVKAPQV